MYEYGRRVWVKPFDRIAYVIERNYTSGKPRHVQYIVEFRLNGKFTGDYMTNKDELSPADYCCDGCNKWRKGAPHQQTLYQDEVQLEFCFLCSKENERLHEKILREGDYV
jgi:hypothetical protein